MFTTSFRPVCAWTWVSQFWTSRYDNSLCLSFCCLFLLLLNLILFSTSLQLPITYTPGSPCDRKIPTAVQGFWCYQSELTSLLWKICLLSLLFNFHYLFCASALIPYTLQEPRIASLYGESNILILLQLSFSRYSNFTTLQIYYNNKNFSKCVYCRYIFNLHRVIIVN